MSDEIREQKKILRREMRRKLEENSFSPREDAMRILDNLKKIPCFLDAETIAIFIDFKNEPPVRWIVPELFRERKNIRVAVPLCVGKEMLFYAIRPPRCGDDGEPVFTDLEPGYCGILEPGRDLRNSVQKFTPPENFDLVLVPGLAFDPTGRRLGRGAGFYDRFLEKIRHDAWTIGIAHELQILERVPVEPLDRAVDAVVTPYRAIIGARDEKQ